jgi:D-alanyl-D-alanine carboxypeptidase/D-alanyl-D-alanine-endopeptidase (penicillin-binding protein 4)
MRHLLVLMFFSMLIIGCTGARDAARLSSLSVSSSPALKARVDALIADTLFPPGNVGIKVVSLSRNETLYALNEHMLFNPASNQKLFTTAAALNTLGVNALFPTLVSADTSRNLIVIAGFGDPLLSTADLDSLARLCAPALPPGRSWDLGVDVRYFDDLHWGAGWTWDEEPAAYGMFITPLILNNNTVTVRVLPSATPGMPPTVTIDPQTAYIPLINSAVTVADSVQVPLEITRLWRERLNTITVTGQIRTSSCERVEQLSVWRPELYAGTVFAEKLRAQGVQVNTVRVDSASPAPAVMVRFVRAIDTVLTFLNKASDNLSAESVLKSIAASKNGAPGSAREGIAIVNTYLAANGIDTNRISIADGSGLSRYNLTSPATVVALLTAMHRDSLNFPVFFHTLPIAGVDGTIGGRMKRTPAEGNLRAKTGTLSAVTALSGYVNSADGEILAFSILMQNYASSSRAYRAVQDAIGALLAALRRDAL